MTRQDPGGTARGDNLVAGGARRGWEAARLIEGVVVRGDGRGRQLGYPTANVVPSRRGALAEEVLGDGVYAGLLRRQDGTVERAAVSIGRRPTYYEQEAERLVEAYLLDFADDLYGEAVAVLVGPKVRGQRRFSSEGELVDQIGADVEEVRRLTEHPAPPEAWRGA